MRPERVRSSLSVELLVAAVALIVSVGPVWRPSARGEGAAAEPATPRPPAKETAVDEARRKWSPPKFTDRQAERDAMARVIKSYDLTDEAVLKAMAAVPRHEFVPADLSRQAYGDHPLPIGYGQTISQPYIVAEMTRQLALKPASRVLEIGTGSGYQAAVLTYFTLYVYTVEIVKPLADAAENRLRRLGYDVVEVRHGDGFNGWPEKGPFDAIIVTCTAGQIPPPLLDQLKPGGRMVIPVGGVFSVQHLMLVEKDKDGKVRSGSLMEVRFVPLLRADPTGK
jgi:protein-L-isoaspartate(D-aspartate) O-methyltransferase